MDFIYDTLHNYYVRAPIDKMSKKTAHDFGLGFLLANNVKQDILCLVKTALTVEHGIYQVSRDNFQYFHFLDEETFTLLKDTYHNLDVLLMSKPTINLKELVEQLFGEAIKPCSIDVYTSFLYRSLYPKIPSKFYIDMTQRAARNPNYILFKILCDKYNMKSPVNLSHLYRDLLTFDTNASSLGSEPISNFSSFISTLKSIIPEESFNS